MLNALFRSLRSGFVWASAVVLVILPPAVAADFGGVLWWTQYVASLAVIAATVCALPALIDPRHSTHPAQYLILIPLGLWLFYSWLQTVPVPAQAAAIFSPASHSAYTQWIAPFLSPAEMPTRFPASIDRLSSRHALFFLGPLMAVSFAAISVFRRNGMIAVFFAVTALCVAGHALFGVYRLADPEFTIWNVRLSNDSFGTFVNGNNAALFFNLGVAASLGLLAWRLAILTGQEVDDADFEFNDLASLVSDAPSAIGVAGVMCSLAGLFLTGSRGGMAAAVVGLVLARGWLRQRRGPKSIPVVSAALVAVGLLLFLPVKVSLARIVEFRLFSPADTETLWNDGRLAHWRDGWSTALGHLPGGSGLATYAHAYLPYQQTSSRSWYHHAENLWLELFVEQGVLGIAFLIVVVLLLMRALNRIGESVEPVDQGVRIAGWYAMASILVSQSFDYGLILPANSILIVVLSSIILARDHQLKGSGYPESSEIRSRDTVQSALVASVVLVVLAMCTVHLRHDAERDALIKSATASFEAAKSDPQALDAWIARLRRAVSVQPWPAAEDMLCEYEYERLCWNEAVAADPQTREQAIDFFRSTRPLSRRSTWRKMERADQPAAAKIALSPPDHETYQDILRASNASLKLLPLGMTARKWQLYLDFVHGDEERSDAALTQLTQFYRRNPRMLIRLAAFARDGDDNERAMTLLKSASRLAPFLAAEILEVVSDWSHAKPEEILDDNALVWRAAADYILRNERENESLIKICLARLECEQCENLAERSECESWAAELSFALDRQDEVIKHYQRALRLTPENASLRLRFIERLKQTGNRAEARRQARSGRQILPDDDRFETIIKQMAAEDNESSK